jgi:hypothetical protein
LMGGRATSIFTSSEATPVIVPLSRVNNANECIIFKNK